MNKYALTMKIIRSVRKKTDTAVLFYSAGGKDGIALLDMISREFPRVICYFMYLVKNLDHTNIYLNWAVKKYPNVEVRQIPHYMLTVIKKNGFFCEPDEEIKKLKVGDVEELVRNETGVSYLFNGMKGVDGYMKRMRLKLFAKSGYISPKGMVYPLALWSNKEVLRYIQARNLIPPMTYGDVKAVSQGVGLDIETLLYLKKRFPNDYAKILYEFPYSEKLIFDYEKEQNKAT